MSYQDWMSVSSTDPHSAKRAERTSLAPYNDATLIPAVTPSRRRIDPTRSVLLSVVVPCHNEEEVISHTHDRLTTVLREAEELDFEIVYVDDGSSDATLGLLRNLQHADPHVRVLSLSRNFGHQHAITAGLEHAVGDAVAVIDADGQDPPEAIGDMVGLWRRGADVVYGVRTSRQGETAFKRWTAKAFYRLMRRLADVPAPVDAGDFRLLDRRVVDAFLAMPERHRYIRGMVAWTGFRQEPFPYERAPRAAGETKYRLAKMLRFAVDGILSHSQTPLRLAIWTGLACSVLAFAGIVYALALRLLTDEWVTGWTLLFVTILFMGGAQMLMLGILGEYLGRIYNEAKRRPLYLLKERLGFPPTAKPETAVPAAETAQPAAETAVPAPETAQPAPETAQPAAETAQAALETADAAADAADGAAAARGSPPR